MSLIAVDNYEYDEDDTTLKKKEPTIIIIIGYYFCTFSMMAAQTLLIVIRIIHLSPTNDTQTQTSPQHYLRCQTQ